MSVRQIEVSRTLVFAAFRHAHGFFEALVTDYLDIACPEQGKLIFFRHPGGALAHPRCSSHFKTKVITRLWGIWTIWDRNDTASPSAFAVRRTRCSVRPVRASAVRPRKWEERTAITGSCSKSLPGALTAAGPTLKSRSTQGSCGTPWPHSSPVRSRPAPRGRKAVSIGWVRCARVARVRSSARLVALVHNVQPRGLVERRMPQGGIVLRQRNGDITEGMPARVWQRHRTQHPLDLGSDRLVATAAPDGDQLRLLGRSGSSVTIGGCPL
jgi:hypothetical protein